MNEQQIASAQNSAPAGVSEIPGIARVGTIVPPSAEPASSPSQPSGSTIMGDVVSRLLVVVSRVLNPSLLETSLAASKKLGHYAVLAGAALTIVYAIYGAIKFDSFAVFALGLGFVVALAVAQFAAMRFLDASNRIIANTPSRISSTAFPDCVGLLVLLLAAATILGGIASSIATRSVIPLLPALLLGAVLTSFGAVTLHPRMVNVVTGDGSAGEEAIGLLSFFSKAGLKLVPLLFLLFSAAGALTILVGFFGEGGAFASMANSVLNALPLRSQVPAGLSGSALVLFACLVPIFTYFVFLLQYLFVDVLRAVLSVPAKLDALRR
jgi:hypothetical protein